MNKHPKDKAPGQAEQPHPASAAAASKKAREASGEEPAEQGSGAGASDDEDIQILGVTATDDAGVALEDEEDAEPVIIDEEAEEFEVPSDEFDSAPGRGAGAASASAVTAELDAARAQVQELREQLMRASADFDNFRKRVERDRVEERKQATAGLLRNLLPVLDSFRWALASAQKGEDPAVKGFADGFRLIETQLLEVLKAAGLEPVPAGGIFDPTVHEALMQETTTDKPHMTVLEVFETGWWLGGRLLRPARVKVANNPAGSGPSPEGGAEDSSPSGAESATTH